MPRLLFSKEGNAVWISHLDLMRLFQRAFKRAGLKLTHTQGFNQRPSVSIALPLSVGIESQCELLDFDLEEEAGTDEIMNSLNQSLIDGVCVHSVYSDGKKLKHLAYMDCELKLEYDDGIPNDCVKNLQMLFARDTLPVDKKGKNGIVSQDIIPMIQSLSVAQTDDTAITICAKICCQNPTLNPMQICAAIEKYLPEFTPSFVKYKRMEIYDAEHNIFR